MFPTGSRSRARILLLSCLPLLLACSHPREDAHSSVFLQDRAARKQPPSTARVELRPRNPGEVISGEKRDDGEGRERLADLSVRALRERLKKRGLSDAQIRSCVEKREMVALLAANEVSSDLPFRAECLGVDSASPLGFQADESETSSAQEQDLEGGGAAGGGERRAAGRTPGSSARVVDGRGGDSGARERVAGGKLPPEAPAPKLRRTDEEEEEDSGMARMLMAERALLSRNQRSVDAGAGVGSVYGG
ncbi:hypothetical protein T484DRAFT_1884934, partial [Baffinella frigidus]